MTSDQLQDLLEKYLADTITEAEFRQLWSTLDISERDADWYAAMDSLLENNELHGLSGDARMESALLTIKAKLANDHSIPTAKRTHFLKRAWFRYAAILLLMAGTATFLYLHNRPQKEIIVKNSADIAPGGNKAILTLSDGRTIMLDSAANGALAQQGNTKILKLNAGSLAYQSGALGGEAGYNTISTPRGGKYQIILPDGTKIWLNAASSIRFPTVFAGNSRKVEMTGEAYMEVAKSAKQSFTVKANGVDIQVLGTSFNINAYENETTLKTTLISGSIKVMSASGPSAEAVTLKPGQQAIVSLSGQSARGQTITTIPSIDAKQVMAWKNDVFDFEDVDFEEVMRQLERWYDIEVVYKKGVPDIRFGGKLNRNISLNDLLEILERTEVHFKREGERRLVVGQP